MQLCNNIVPRRDELAVPCLRRQPGPDYSQESPEVKETLKLASNDQGGRVMGQSEIPDAVKLLDEPGSATIGATLRVTDWHGTAWKVSIWQRGGGYGAGRFVWTASGLLDDAGTATSMPITFRTAADAWWDAVDESKCGFQPHH